MCNASSDQAHVLGVPEGPYLFTATAECRRLFDRDLSRLETAGCEVRRVKLMSDIEDIHQRHSDLCNYEFAKVHTSRLEALGVVGGAWLGRAVEMGYPEGVLEIISLGLSVDKEAMQRGLEGMSQLRQELDVAMDAHGIDAWVSPASVTGYAPRLDERSTGDPAMNRPWTHAGLPVVSLVTEGVTVHGVELPTAIQVVGKHGGDEALLALARSLEVKLAA